MIDRAKGRGGDDERKRGLTRPRDPREDVRGTRHGPPAQRQEWSGRTGPMRPQPDHGEESYRGSGRLDGMRALITGADSGIGRAVAIAYAREGADVAIHYRQHRGDAEETLRWVRDAGRNGVLVQGDLTDPRQCREVVEQAVERLEGLDILVNNAAYQCEEEDFSRLTEEQIERTFRTNILGYIYVAQVALEHLQPGGVILNTGSVTGLEGHKSLIDYAATKGAIHTFTKSLAQAVADRGIRVNCVAPGPVWTPLIPATFASDERVAAFGGDTLWQRPAQPVEIAPSYVFLASSDARYYTGEVLAPTGRATTR